MGIPIKDQAALKSNFLLRSLVDIRATDSSVTQFIFNTET